MIFLSSLALLAASFLLAYFVPAISSASVFSGYNLPATVLFAAFFGVLAFIAISRRERLKQAVATELNKIRRIYHLGKNLGSSPNLRGWFTELHGFIYDYLGAFEKMSMTDYDKGNVLFRKIAYHVYTVPELKNTKEQVLYGELLDATSVVSDARQKIRLLIDSRYSKHHWFEITLIIIGFTAANLNSVSAEPSSRFVAALTLSLGYLLALSFFIHDVWTGAKAKALAREYARNIARLELRRE